MVNTFLCSMGLDLKEYNLLNSCTDDRRNAIVIRDLLCANIVMCKYCSVQITLINVNNFENHSTLKILLII